MFMVCVLVWDKNRDMAARVIECLLFQFLRKKAGEVERIMRPFISMRGKNAGFRTYLSTAGAVLDDGS